MRLGGSVFYKGTDPEQYALAHQYAGLAFREKFSIIKYPVKVHMQSAFPYKGRKNLICMNIKHDCIGCEESYTCEDLSEIRKYIYGFLDWETDVAICLPSQTKCQEVSYFSAAASMSENDILPGIILSTAGNS